MLAVIGGTGPLPALLVAAERARGGAVMVCELAGYPVTGAAGVPLIRFRIEHLGSLMTELAARGVTDICLAGVVRRPVLDPGAVDGATAPLIAPLRAAMARGDDGALRAVLAIFAAAGFGIRAAHQIAPDLLLPAGVPTRVPPGATARADAALGEATVAAMGRADTGQACVIGAGQVLAREGPEGTEAMLASVAAPGGLLFKAPKPDQDRRADLPTIGPDSVRQAAAAGLAGIVVAANGVLVIDRAAVIAECDRLGLFLWSRPPGEAP